MGIGACGGERLAEEVVAAAVANRRRYRGVLDGMHRQHDGDNAVATIGSLGILGVDSGFCDDFSVEVEALTLTDVQIVLEIIDWVHGQSQRNHAVAAVDALQRMGVSPCGGERLPEEVVATALANCSGDRRVEDIVDCQGQGNHTVATADGLQGVGVRACGGERLPEEVVAAAVADFSGDGRVDDITHGQRQRDDTVTAVDRLCRVGVGACDGERLPEEVVAVAVANRNVERGVIDGVDGQGQRNHAVAAVDG